MSTDNPLEVLAQSLHAACLRDLPEIAYRERDWPAHRAVMDTLTTEEKAAQYARERATGQPEGPFLDKTRRPAVHDCEITMFPQLWSSTALGFPGIGGQAFTRAYTVVVACDRAKACAVYFGGRFAYLVEHERQNAEFKADLANRALVACADAAARYTPKEISA